MTGMCLEARVRWTVATGQQHGRESDPVVPLFCIAPLRIHTFGGHNTACLELRDLCLASQSGTLLSRSAPPTRECLLEGLQTLTERHRIGCGAGKKKNEQPPNKQGQNKNENTCLPVRAEKQAFNVYSAIIDGVFAECETLCSHSNRLFFHTAACQ